MVLFSVFVLVYVVVGTLGIKQANYTLYKCTYKLFMLCN